MKSCSVREQRLLPQDHLLLLQQVCEELLYKEQRLPCQAHLVLLLISHQVWEELLYNMQRLQTQDPLVVLLIQHKDCKELLYNEQCLPAQNHLVLLLALQELSIKSSVSCIRIIFCSWTHRSVWIF